MDKLKRLPGTLTKQALADLYGGKSRIPARAALNITAQQKGGDRG